MPPRRIPVSVSAKALVFLTFKCPRRDTSVCLSGILRRRLPKHGYNTFICAPRMQRFYQVTWFLLARPGYAEKYMLYFQFLNCLKIAKK